MGGDRGYKTFRQPEDLFTRAHLSLCGFVGVDVFAFLMTSAGEDVYVAIPMSVVNVFAVHTKSKDPGICRSMIPRRDLSAIMLPI